MSDFHGFEKLGKFVDSIFNWYMGIPWYWQIILLLIGVIAVILIWYSINQRNG